MCINGYNSRIPYLCGLSAFWYRSTMRKINHSRIVAGNCFIVPVNSNNSRAAVTGSGSFRLFCSVLCMILLLYIFLLPGISPPGCHRTSCGRIGPPGTPRYPGPVIQVPYVHQKIILYFQIWSVNDFTGNTTKSN